MLKISCTGVQHFYSQKMCRTLPKLSRSWKIKKLKFQDFVGFSRRRGNPASCRSHAKFAQDITTFRVADSQCYVQLLRRHGQSDHNMNDTWLQRLYSCAINCLCTSLSGYCAETLLAAEMATINVAIQRQSKLWASIFLDILSPILHQISHS